MAKNRTMAAKHEKAKRYKMKESLDNAFKDSFNNPCKEWKYFGYPINGNLCEKEKEKTYVDPGNDVLGFLVRLSKRDNAYA